MLSRRFFHGFRRFVSLTETQNFQSCSRSSSLAAPLNLSCSRLSSLAAPDNLILCSGPEKPTTRFFSLDSIAQAVGVIKASVVRLSVDRDGEIKYGTGIVVGDGKTIMTCAYILVDFNKWQIMDFDPCVTVDIVLSNGDKVTGQSVVANKELDFAIIKMKVKTIPAKIVSTNTVVGEFVLSYGFPGRFSSPSVTKGIVSCVNRTSGELNMGGFLKHYLQCDCSGSPGVSGAPLINLKGEVIGMRFGGGITGLEGINFAMPMSFFGSVLKRFAKYIKTVKAKKVPEKIYGISPGFLHSNSFAKAAELIGPSFVNIFVGEDKDKGRDYCSGIIVDEKGTIITCAHVMHYFTRKNKGFETVEKEVTIVLRDGREIRGAFPVLVDYDYDLAIIKITSDFHFTPASFGFSKNAFLGEWIISMGNPGLPNSLQVGIISCLRRTKQELGVRGPCTEYIETDCPLNYGNSGAPLVNLDGLVIGVNCRRGTEFPVGYAIPVDIVCMVLEKHGLKVERFG